MCDRKPARDKRSDTAIWGWLCHRDHRVRSLFTIGLLSFLFAIARPANAEESKPRRAEWIYPRFRAAELTMTLGVHLTMLYVEHQSAKLGAYSPNNGWKQGVLFDDTARDWLRARSSGDRTTAAIASDWLWNFTNYYPVVGDALITPLLFDRFNTKTALELSLLNWETTIYAWFLVRVGHRAIGRDRPSLQECANDPEYSGVCKPTDGGNKYASFPGGHAAMSFTSASLVCSHHAALPLYGKKGWDRFACLLTMSTATATTILRAVADRHWLSDLMVGAGIGLAVGLTVPYFLHYAPKYRTKHALITAVPTYEGASGTGITIAGFL
jgi:membrane-associated phospholipid phosphatase